MFRNGYKKFLEKEFSISLKPDDECGRDNFEEDVEVPHKENGDGKSAECDKGFKKKIEKLNYSGSTTRRILLASRIVKGNTAKRKNSKAKSQVENNMLQKVNKKLEDQQNNDERLDINLEHFQQCKSNDCGLENPHLGSEIQNLTQRNVDMLPENDVSTNKIDKRLNMSYHSSEMPVSRENKYSTQTTLENLSINKDSQIVR
ncbi:hypothetical protein L9F63_001379 [Diploptera punctata]|uniref:Uncharacterized protein n=1 Tax=Diploptera punctata TaxID=6984 RepID=A0AAD8A3P3_DIPPU|nr:hypothetical protein L9F63_001379 [Diploptera punctata]